MKKRQLRRSQASFLKDDVGFPIDDAMVQYTKHLPNITSQLLSQICHLFPHKVGKLCGKSLLKILGNKKARYILHHILGIICRDSMAQLKLRDTRKNTYIACFNVWVVDEMG